MPAGFNIGPLFIYYYGIILMLGASAGAWLASVEARRKGQNTDLVWDAFFWVLIGGILGARIWHILTPPPSMVERGITTLYYLTHPLDAMNIRNGGLGIPGAVIGGVIALVWFCRRKKLNPLMWLDIAAPGLALGQAIGRWVISSTRRCTGGPPRYHGGFLSNQHTGIPVLNNLILITPYFCTNPSGAWDLWACCFGSVVDTIRY